MPRYIIRRAYDAYQYYTATVEAASGAEAAEIARGKIFVPDIEWKDDGIEEFKELSLFTITREGTNDPLEFLGPDFKAEGFTE